MALICIPLMINDAEHLFCAFRPSGCLLWGSVYVGICLFFDWLVNVFVAELNELFLHLGDQS